MAIAYGRSLGSVLTTATLTTVNAATVGETIIIYYAHNAGGVATGFTDSAGNTYTLAEANATNARASVWYCHVTSNLTAGSSIFYTGAATTYRFAAHVFTGLDVTAGVDQHGNGGANVSGTAAQVTLGTTTLADELIVAAVSASGSTSFTPLASYTELDDVAGTPTLETIYRIVSATGVYTPGSTRAASGPWGIAAATFKKGALNSNFKNQVMIVG